MMHSTHELFSTGPHSDGRLLTQLDARVKLIVSLAAILAVLLSTRVWFPLTTAACCLGLLLASRAPLGSMACALAGPLGLAAVVCLLRALMIGTTPLISFDVGPWQLTLTKEGLWDGCLIASRVLGSVSVIVVLCKVTPAAGIFAALRWARLPRTWIEIAVLMYRYIFTLSEQAVSVLSAQRIRLGYAGLRRSIRSMANLGGVVLLRSIDQAERTHEAMIARGYQGSWPIPAPPTLRANDLWLLGGCLSAIGLAYFLAERCF
jgi:cobalt/nickel transport system permease protein